MFGCRRSHSGLFVFVAGLGLGLGLGLARADEGVRTLELYATTDIHGHLTTHPLRLGARTANRFGAAGGVAVLAGMMQNARAAAPGRVMLLDGGDMMQGTLESNLTEGASMIRALSLVGYTAVALGNHEFDYGPAGPHAKPESPADDPLGALRARIKEAKFPILSANVKLLSGEKLFPAYVIREIDGVKVAIIGATTTQLLTTTVKANLVGVRVEPIVPAVIAAAEAAKREGARVFVLTMHAGAECTRALRAFTQADVDDLAGCEAKAEGFAVTQGLADAAKQGAPRFSAVVGGHSHQPNAALVGGIPFLQAGKAGDYLAHIAIEVRGRGANATPTGHFALDAPTPVCARLNDKGKCAADGDPNTHALAFLGAVTPDAKVTASIAGDLAKARVIADKPVGITLPEGMPAHYATENALGDFTADALRLAAKTDLGLINGGGLRDDLPAGPLVYGALYESFPFENEVVTVELTGAQLRNAVLHNLHAHFGFLSWSGLSVRARCEHDEVLVDITTADGKPLEPARTYRLATADFLATGGDEALSRGKIVGAPAGTVRDAVSAAFHAHGGVLSLSDPALFDAKHPRVVLPGPRPVTCGKIEAHEESTP
jgi:5'-nucleotidase